MRFKILDYLKEFFPDRRSGRVINNGDRIAYNSWRRRETAEKRALGLTGKQYRRLIKKLRRAGVS